MNKAAALIVFMILLGSLTACSRDVDIVEYDSRIEQYDCALQSTPDNSITCLDRGDVYYLRWRDFGNVDDLNAALSDYTQAIQMDPGHAEAFERRGRAYSDMGIGVIQFNDLAITDLTRAIDLNPRSARAFYFRALAYSHMNDLVRSLRDASTAIELDSKLASPYRLRGQVYLQLGEEDKARVDFQTYLRLSPDAIDPEIDPPNLRLDPDYVVSLQEAAQ